MTGTSYFLFLALHFYPSYSQTNLQEASGDDFPVGDDGRWRSPDSPPFLSSCHPTLLLSYHLSEIYCFIYNLLKIFSFILLSENYFVLHLCCLARLSQKVKRMRAVPLNNKMKVSSEYLFEEDKKVKGNVRTGVKGGPKKIQLGHWWTLEIKRAEKRITDWPRASP